MSDVSNWELGRYCSTCSLLLPPGSTNHTCIGTAPKREPDYFAHKIFDSSGKEVYHPSRRDYFAAAALTGILTSYKNNSLNAPPDVHHAVNYADEIIQVLDKVK